MRHALQRGVAWACAVGGRSVWLLAVALGCTGSPRPADTIVLASGSDLESANPVVTVHPMSRQVQRYMLFVPLVHLDATMQSVPALARRWLWSDSGRVLTFILRDDVFWHDGVRTTAEDARFTYAAVRHPDAGAPRAGDLRDVIALEAPNDTTFVVRFAAAPPRLPLLFAELPPVPAHHLREVPPDAWRAAPFSTQPVGNGPFRFVSRTPGVRWRFERNARHPEALGGPPWARQVVIAVVDEPSTKLAGLVSGDLDVAGVSPSMAELVERDPLLRLESPPVLFSSILAFNTTAVPFDDVRVRRAVSLAIDRERLVQAAVAGFGVPSRYVVPPGVFPATSGLPSTRGGPSARSVLSTNAERSSPPLDTLGAAQLLDAAGWTRSAGGMRARDGKPLSITLLTAGSGELAAEQLLQDDLRRLGIALTIRTAELATFLSTLRAPAKTFDLAYTGIPGDLALGHLRALLHGTQRGAGLGYSGFANAMLDGALDSAFSVRTPEAQRAAWSRVETLVDSLAPIAVLYHARGVQGRSASLEQVVMDLRGELATITRWRRKAP